MDPGDISSVVKMINNIENYVEETGNFPILPKPGWCVDEIQEITVDEALLEKTGSDTPKTKILQKSDMICNRLYTFVKSQGKIFHPNDSNPRQTERWASKCVVENSLLYHVEAPYENARIRNRIFLPQCLIVKILTGCHDDPLAGHFGRENTYYRIAEHFYWPNYRKDVYDYCKSCKTCSEY